MPFQIKDFNSISAAQVNHARSVTQKITDFQKGSVARTLMEAVAVEMEELYLQIFLGLREAIPVSTFTSFGFGKLPAAYARGAVLVSANVAPASDLIVFEGTIFTATDGRVYKANQFVTWPAGRTYVNVPVSFSEPGLVGNLSAGQIVSSNAFGSGYTLENFAITTGRDIETDAEREARFASYISALSSGTLQACVYTVKSAVVLDNDGNILEYVTRVGLIESAGTVLIYIYSSGSTPSQKLIDNAQLLLDGTRDESTGEITSGQRAAGVRVSVLSMTERAVSMSASVVMLSGYALNSSVIQKIRGLYSTALRSILPGTSMVIDELAAKLLSVPGVFSVDLSATSNIVCAESEIVIAGTLTVVSG